MNYLSLNTHLKERFGKKVYKLSLSGGMTCPNRDGTLGTRGCIFCSGSGSGDFCEDYDPDIAAQIERAKLRVAKKAGDNAGYIAYFQNFSNTYAHISHLSDIFYQAIEHPDIVGLSIATRPDCLGDDVVALIGELAKIKPVWVELGLQSAHEATAEYIRRGYKNGVYEKAVRDLHLVGAEVVTHVILGLPYETEQMMYDTVEYAGRFSDGIKLQLLHVLKNTDLEAEYAQGKFKTLEMDEYIRIVAHCVELLAPHIVIHRITGDGAKRDLVAPLWSADKKRVLNAVNKYFCDNNIIQGGKRKALRLGGYDYSKDGCYFITICVKDRAKILSRIVGDDAHIVPTPIGNTVIKYIESINNLESVSVDKYVVMPDHIHLLLSIKKGTMWASSPTVPSVIRSFKTLVTKETGKSIWQRSYYDHIIRNEKDYLEKWQYIDNNPLKKGTV